MQKLPTVPPLSLSAALEGEYRLLNSPDCPSLSEISFNFTPEQITRPASAGKLLFDSESQDVSSFLPNSGRAFRLTSTTEGAFTKALADDLNELLKSGEEKIRRFRNSLNVLPSKTLDRLGELNLRELEPDHLNRLLLEDALQPFMKKIEDVRLEALFAAIHDQHANRSALCLSGGGIRSATFGLGVLQGLARHQVLKHLDYVSTVSGGGYIGAWFSAWVNRHVNRTDGVIRELAKSRDSITEPEPEPIRHLRSYSNYLTPHLGALSGDTLAAIGIYLRNLSLNLIVLVPFLLALLMLPRIQATLLMLPRIHATVFSGSAGEAVKHYAYLWSHRLGGVLVPYLLSDRLLLLIGLFLGWLAIFYIDVNMPGDTEKLKRRSFWYQRRDQGSFLRLSLCPLFASSLLLTTYWYWERPEKVSLWIFTAFGALYHLVAGVLSRAALTGKTSTLGITAAIGAAIGGVIGYLGWPWGYFRFALLGLAFALIATLVERRSRQTAEKRLGLLWLLLAASIAALILELTAVRCGIYGRGTPSALSLAIIAALLAAVAYTLSMSSENWKHLATIAATGGFGGLLLYFVAQRPPFEIDAYACFAAPIFIFVFLAAATVFVGLVSRWTSDEDREWWARSGGWTLGIAFFWAAASALVTYGPIAVYKLPLWVMPLGSISGLISILLGRAGKTPANREQTDDSDWKARIPNAVLGLAAPVFALFIIAILSVTTTALIKSLPWHVLRADVSSAINDLPVLMADPTSSHPAASLIEALKNWGVKESLEHLQTIGGLGFVPAVALTGTFLLIAFGCSRFVDVNKFSMHSMYRNRLMRAYLGASRGRERRPNPFTGFDPKDNVPMTSLARKPLHLINIALNLVGGADLAWQERKAESFTVTALHSGSARLGFRASEEYGGVKGGISLATAVAISGAAASPNMGYHSSPALSFLLTLFNVRLGWWLGNPGVFGSKTASTSGTAPYLLESPRNSLTAILREAFGMTDDTSPYVYLSDGGHFENLGLYEMVRRRCHLIVAIDAGADARFAFDDLGNAIRKIRIDFGIPIEMQCRFVFPRKSKKTGKYCAVGKIRYTCVDEGGKDGTLLYIKPAFYGNEPVDVYNYATVNEDFPHETTGDQFFSESQFESYRMLGSHIIDEICGDPEWKAHDLEAFFGVANKYLKTSGTPWRLHLTNFLKRL